MKLLITLVLVVSFLAGRPGFAAGGLVPEPLPGTGSSLTWKGRQFLQADQKGRVYLLRTPELQVFPIARSGELGEAEKLKTLPRKEKAERVVSAALSPDGRDWLLREFAASGELRYFRGGEEKTLPAPAWRVTCTGLPGGRPVLAVHGMKDSAVGISWPEEPPMLLGWSGARWETVVSEAINLEALGIERQSDHRFATALYAAGDQLLANGSKGSVWIASRSVYRLRHFSASGRPLVEIRLGEGKIELRNPSAEERTADRERARKAETPELRTWAGWAASTPVVKKPIEAFTVAQGGVVYILSRTKGEGEEGPTLDRFDPVRGTLERTSLRLSTTEGKLQMAAGQDGLFLVSTLGSGGRWWISWEALNRVRWQEVSEAEIRFHPKRS